MKLRPVIARFLLPVAVFSAACHSQPASPTARLATTDSARGMPSLPELEPVLGEIPDISTDAKANLTRLKALYASIDSVIQSYPDYETAKQHLTERQIQVWENEEAVSREDHLDIGPVGCSWYCGGGPDSIYSSTVHSPEQGFTYAAEHAHDCSLRTAWVEGASGPGIGERITYRFPKSSPPVTAVELFNGYMKSERAWHDNTRIKQLKLSVNGQPQALLNLKDTKAKQRFEIGSFQNTAAPLLLTFEITAVYAGARYDDAALAELEFDGTGVHCFAAGTAVATPEGPCAIERLRVGDRVLSVCESSGKLDTAVVQGLARQRHHNLYDLQFGPVRLTVTDDHPFFYEGTFYSVRANETYGLQTAPLKPGQRIAFLQNGRLRPRTLTSMKKIPTCEETYTITRLDRGTLFFANGACVASEAIPTLAMRRP